MEQAQKDEDIDIVVEESTCVPFAMRSMQEDFVKACEVGDERTVQQMLDCADFQFESVYDGIVAAFDNDKRCVIKSIIETRGIEHLSDSRNGETLFFKLERTRSDIANHILDTCYYFQDSGQKLHFDFRFLEKSCHKLYYSKHYKQMDSVTNMNKEEISILEGMELDSDLLLHPVVKGLISWKWTRYIAWFFFFNLAVYLVFLGFLTGFALYVSHPRLNHCGYNSTNRSSSSCDVSKHRQALLILSATVINVLMLTMELCQSLNLHNMVQSKKMFSCSTKQGRYRCCKTFSHWINWHYFLSVTNYFEIMTYILSIVFVTAVYHECLCPSHWHWQAGTVAIFLAWIVFILYLNKWPTVGIYIEMFSKILQRFMKLAIFFFLLMLAFSLSFHMLFYPTASLDKQSDTFHITFAKVLSFTISGPETSVFSVTEEDDILYPPLSYTMWIIFCVVMSILFINFMVGLAVDDVQELRKQGDKKRMRIMVNMYKEVEAVMVVLSALFKCMKCSWCFKLLKKRSPPGQSRTVVCSSLYVKAAFLWGDEIQSLIKQTQRKTMGYDKES